MIPLIEVPKVVKFIETGARLELIRGSERGKLRIIVLGTEFLLGIMKKVLEMESGDGCMTL